MDTNYRFIYDDTRVLQMVDNDTTTYSFSEIHILVDTIYYAHIYFKGRGLDYSLIDELTALDTE